MATLALRSFVKLAFLSTIFCDCAIAQGGGSTFSDVAEESKASLRGSGGVANGDFDAPGLSRNLQTTCCADSSTGYSQCTDRSECATESKCTSGRCKMKWLLVPVVRDGCCSKDGLPCDSIDPSTDADCQYLSEDCIDCGGTWISDAPPPPTSQPTKSPTNPPTLPLPTSSPTTANPTNPSTPNPTASPNVTPATEAKYICHKNSHNYDQICSSGSPIFDGGVCQSQDDPCGGPKKCWVADCAAPTSSPTPAPSPSPTKNPTTSPTQAPSKSPTTSPSKSPSVSPTSNPTKNPTTSPTRAPSKSPTTSPSKNPSVSPTSNPTKNPTTSPTQAPTKSPTKEPTPGPTSSPTTFQPTGSPTTGKPTAAPTNAPTASMVIGQVDVPIVPNSNGNLTVSLPPSSANTLLTLSLVRAKNDGHKIPVSRSYDGYNWEMLHPLLLSVLCEGGCSIVLPPANIDGNDIHYVIEEFTPSAPSNEKIFAKLLLQATYGPTEASLADAIALGSAADWVRDQIDMPASLLRAHYRRRTNGHLKTDIHHHATRLACEQGSRYNRHAFNRWRDVGKTITEVATGSGSYYLKIDGIVRTEVVTPPSSEHGSLTSPYVLCRPNRDFEDKTLRMSDFAVAPNGQEGTMLVAATSSDCMNQMSVKKVTMPSVYFSDPVSALGNSVPTVNLVSIEDPYIIEAKLLQDLVAPSTCSDFKMTWPNFVQDSTSGLYYVEDRRAELYENFQGSGVEKKRLLGNRCPKVPRTFLNEDSCVPRRDCGPPVFSGEFDLNAENLRKFYTLDGKYVYRVQNFPLVGTSAPCNTGDNRFVRKSSDSDSSGCSNDSSGQFPEVASAIEAYLSNLDAQTQSSARVLDIFDTVISCADPDANDSLGASFTVTIPGTNEVSCWTHSYYREWSVFVMNDWVANHNGNPVFFAASKPNPIAAVAEHENLSGDLEESVTLNFPGWDDHAWNFHNNRWRFETELIGSWGDRVSFNNLPPSAKSSSVVTALGGLVVADSGEIVEVCGSPGEVANDPSLGHQYHLQKWGDAEEEYAETLDQDHERWFANHILWNTVSLNADDQLRQRVAWALSSIFVVTENDIAREHEVEAWATYYDIFVRNCFGNFFNILKEVSFSPLMADMLTYKESKSLAYQVENNGVLLFPDENFAREIMQLFSIGLVMLNQDGTKMTDENGEYIPTYTNEDIMNFARGWTNFAHQEGDRDNIEPEWAFIWLPNAIDAMWLPTSEGRDVFPKLTLTVNGKQGHIGDKVQRCDAMPSKPWLRRGAEWQFRPNSQSLQGKKDPDWWATPETWTQRFVLDANTSSLYAKLCNFNDVTGECEFKSTVILDEDIPCDGTCEARQAIWDYPGINYPCECSVDLPRTVRVDHSPTSAPVWYEYVSKPCIQMAFPENGAMNSVREIGASGYGNKAMCADNRLSVAGTVCCDSNGANPVNICVFKGERTTYSKASDRCAAYGRSTCSWDTVPISWECGTDVDYGKGDWSVDDSIGMRFSWTSEPCSMSVQINQDGKVAMIHKVGSIPVKERVGVDTGTYFGVLWGGDGSYPTSDNNQCGSCDVQGSTCLCSTTIETSAVFDGTFIPTFDEVMGLHIGASDPNAFDIGTYTVCTAPICNSLSYNIYSLVGVSSDSNFELAFDKDTIFEVPHAGSVLFLSNTESRVIVDGTYSFRNPPMFNSPIDPSQRDGLYETDAILKQYFEHPNTAPFIATKLISLLISSNPSPRYVKVVADAFSTGTFDSGGVSFGSGNYGDLEATVAAIMLDSEARSSTLDEDSNHGRAREPLLKTIHVMRSMDLSTESGFQREVDMILLTDRGLGQESFNAPSVFSFFLSEYQPVGPVQSKGLVAPETQLFDAPKLISFVNGLFSLPRWGLTDCPGWLKGVGSSQSRFSIIDYPDGGEFGCTTAENEGVPLQLRWRPNSWGGATNIKNAPTLDVVQDVDLLLTGGRLHESSMAILEQVYDNANTGNDPDLASLKAVLQHFSVTPEFHISNNLVDSKSTTSARPTPNITIPKLPPAVTGYKAIVYMFMAGGLDSFSALVPMDCTLHDQYQSVRGDVAIDSWKLLSIDASSSNQPCNSFGVHPSLGNLTSFFIGGDASFVANIGPLVQSMDKFEFESGAKPQPPALFAHNTQTQITQTVHAQDSSAGGVLGRIGDVINAQEGEAVFDAYSIYGTPKVLEGAPGMSKPADVLSGWGVSSFVNAASVYEDNIEGLSQNVATSIYGETFSDSMTNAIYRTRLLKNVTTSIVLQNNDCFGSADISRQFQQVARIIKSRDKLEAKRDVFYVQHGGYDTHDDNGPKLTSLLRQIDHALFCFSDEMKLQGVWNNVTIVSASEFGRTLTSNGFGTDHAWGGNHFIAGGSVKGGVIHGQYPDDLTDAGSLNIGRGRLIPTTPWEGLWKGIAEWFGVTSGNMELALPALQNFETNIFGESDLFDG